MGGALPRAEGPPHTSLGREPQVPPSAPNSSGGLKARHISF